VRKILLCIFILGATYTIQGQNLDSNYLENYQHLLTARLYLSQKVTTYEYYPEDNSFDINYSPNTSLNLGIGATYQRITLNLGYGYQFLNQDEELGQTRYLDLQAHLSADKYILDFFGQFYRGFYLNQETPLPEGEYYTRPDIGVIMIGANFQGIFNYKKYSMRSLLFQDEWQKKSAGSWLLGGQVFYTRGRSDSTIVPYFIEDERGLAQAINFAEIAIAPGYAHNFVIKKHFYFGFAFKLGLGMGVSNFEESETEERVSNLYISPNPGLRVGLGYNSEKSAFSILVISQSVNTNLNDGDQRFLFTTGNVRINYTRRYSIKKLDKLYNKIFHKN